MRPCAALAYWLGALARPDFRSALVYCLPLVASAALLTLAIRWPAQFSWIVWIALTPLFAVVRVCGPTQAGWLGAVWGASLAVTRVWSHADPVALASWQIFALVVLPALFAACGATLTRRIGFHPLLLALSWVGVELVLSAIGPRTGVLGAAMNDGGAMTTLLISMGYIVAAFFAAYVGALLVSSVALFLQSACTVRSAFARFRGTPLGFVSQALTNLRVVWRGVAPRAPPLHRYPVDLIEW